MATPYIDHIGIIVISAFWRAAGEHWPHRLNKECSNERLSAYVNSARKPAL